MEKKLYRSRSKKVIAGIGGGLGDYMGVDPVIIRILLILFTIFHGIGILVYIILWIVIQEEPYKNLNAESEAASTTNYSENANNNVNELNAAIPPKENIVTNESNKGRIIFGAILIGIGSIFLFDRFIPSFDFEVIFMSGLILLGLFLIINSTKKAEKKP